MRQWNKMHKFVVAALLGSSALSCSRQPASQITSTDAHSYSQPERVRVRHVDLDLSVQFDKKTLRGTATLTIEPAAPGPLVLDTRDLRIEKAEAWAGQSWEETKFALGPADRILGAPLTIELPANATQVRIHYSTDPKASALQWLEPAQTAGKKHPFLFTQSQAIHARSWIPLQDTPGVRVTYSARIRTPENLTAVMSAQSDPAATRKGEFVFRMPQAIPSYLIALAVGDLVFQPTGERTGVWAEKPVVQAAAHEFSDTEKMMQAVEELYGPYRWGRYDLLILPPSFPFGGMENPRMTFATPTVIAGDKSLVSLVSHELAHSWSGNLVTNATWRDFWLNEGFTVYLEWRILEKVYGRERSEMEAGLSRNELEQLLVKLDDRDEILHIDLAGRDPDDGFTDVPYVKGALFLRNLEETFGRERFDAFLRGYFEHFAFQSITTQQFKDYLRANLLDSDAQLAAKVPVEQWIHQPGLPPAAPQPASALFARVSAEAKRWQSGHAKASDLTTAEWSTQEWLHFLRALPGNLSPAQMAELDASFRFTKSRNSEILNQWLLMGIRNGYRPARPMIEEFLTSMGRRKFLKPLYEELVKTEEGKKLARSIYGKARPGYHPIAAATVDGIVGILEK